MSSPLHRPLPLTRVGVVMGPDPATPTRPRACSTPAPAAAPTARCTCCRGSSPGNVSRVGLARVVVEDGVPVGVEREGVVLEPDRGWERGAATPASRIRGSPGSELGLHVMTYVAYGPLGPRTRSPSRATCASGDDSARRTSPTTTPSTSTSTCSTTRTRCSSPSRSPRPDGVPSFAVLHRPMWDLGETKPGEGVRCPPASTDARQ